MVTVSKEGTAKVSLSVSESLSKMSESMYSKTLDTFKTMLRAGEANFLEGYASTLIVSDFLHSAGFITDKAYDAVFLTENIWTNALGIEGFFSTIFGGNSPLAPTLRSRVEQQSGDNEQKGEETSMDAANAAALSAAIQTAMAAA
jgi:hypothetical protein